MSALLLAPAVLCVVWRAWLHPLDGDKAQAVGTLTNLEAFIFESLLNEGDNMVLLGRFSWQEPGQSALVKLSTKPMLSPGAMAQSLRLTLKSYSGAEYCYYDGQPSVSSLLQDLHLCREYNVEVIAPASTRQIERSRPQAHVMIEETPEGYAAVTQPFIKSLPASSISWLYNVLELKKEKERLLYNDVDAESGFILNVDTKWRSHPDCHSVPKAQWKGDSSIKWLYCLAICHRRDLASLRDLRARHLPLLRNILQEGKKTIKEAYGVPSEELRIFVHYHPQFYHFHVHFTSLYTDLGCQVERAHLLSDIIRNLEANGDHYQSAVLTYKLPRNDKLFLQWQSAGKGQT